VSTLTQCDKTANDPMKLTCYQHPDRDAVAKVERLIIQHKRTGGEKKVKMASPVCQECGERAQFAGIAVIWLEQGE
jgi:hypothetical protein